MAFTAYFLVANTRSGPGARPGFVDMHHLTLLAFSFCLLLSLLFLLLLTPPPAHSFSTCVIPLVLFLSLLTWYLLRTCRIPTKQSKMRPPIEIRVAGEGETAVEETNSNSNTRVNTHASAFYFQDLFLQFALHLPDIVDHPHPYQLVKFLSSLNPDTLRVVSAADIADIPTVGTNLSLRKFGRFGGRYAPESQTAFLMTLIQQFKDTIKDVEFWKDFVGSGLIHPTSLSLAEDLTKHVGGARIWLKREDENHGNSHKVRTIVAQILLAKRIGKAEIVIDVGFAGHASVAAVFCARLEMKCTVFIGQNDADVQVDGVRSLREQGAEVFTSENGLGCRSLRAAINDALRYMASRGNSAYYILSGPIGPHPLPLIHRTFQAIVGEEVRTQCMQQMGKEPTALIAPVGIGSGAAGLFAPFLENLAVRCFGVQPVNAAPLTSPSGAPGVLFGSRTYLLQDDEGQILNSTALASDLNTSIVGPELAHWKHCKGVLYEEVSDQEAKDVLDWVSGPLGFVPSMETAYALVKAVEVAKVLGDGGDVVVLVSGKSV